MCHFCSFRGVSEGDSVLYSGPGEGERRRRAGRTGTSLLGFNGFLIKVVKTVKTENVVSPYKTPPFNTCDLQNVIFMRF